MKLYYVHGVEGPWPDEAPAAWGAAVISLGYQLTGKSELTNGVSEETTLRGSVRVGDVTWLETSVSLPAIMFDGPVYVVALREKVWLGQYLLDTSSQKIEQLLTFTSPLYRGVVVIGEDALRQFRTQFVDTVIALLNTDGLVPPKERPSYIRAGRTMDIRNEWLKQEYRRSNL